MANKLNIGIAGATGFVGLEIIKKNKMLTRDSRTVERKKPGQRKARRKFQFSKR